MTTSPTSPDGDLAVVGVEDADVEADGRLPARSRPRTVEHVLLVGERRRDRRRLGRAVPVGQTRGGERLVGPAHDLGRDRRAAVAELAQVRDVARVRELRVRHRREHRRDDQRRGDRLALEEVDGGLGLEHRQHHLAATVPHGREDGERTRGVEHRRDDRVTLRAQDRLRHHHVVRVGDQVAVAQHHALGRARRAARVEEPGERLARDARTELVLAGAGEERLVVVGDRHDALDDAGERARVAVGEQHPRAGVAQRVRQLGLGVAGVERDEHEVPGRDTEVGLDVRVRVRGEDRHPVAGLESEPVQPADELPAA